ncbi:MAG: glycosyltransferase family 39 protein [Myxococcota bacterium]
MDAHSSGNSLTSNLLSKAQELDGRDVWIALSVCILGFVLMMSTMDMGFTRDETFYFHAAELYAKWFEALWEGAVAGTPRAAFHQSVVDAHWGYNGEHPALIKSMCAVSLKIFHEHLGWLGRTASMRAPAAWMSSMLLGGVYLFARQLCGRIGGVIAVGALLTQPRFFFHAHLACFDAPVTALWFAVMFAYWKSTCSRVWGVATGVLWGLALATKLNAFFLPPLMVLHWALVNWRDFGIVRDAHGTACVRSPKLPVAFVAMALLGPLIFYGHWPRIWFDTFERVRWYMAFHLNHVHYFVYAFGENLWRPPFPVSFPFAMTAVTVPLATLVSSVLGAGALMHARGWGARASAWAKALRRRRLPQPDEGADPRGTTLLLWINVLFPLALIAGPETPIFGGTKHWMPAMPFVAIFAAVGVVAAAQRAVDAWRAARGASPAWVQRAVCVVLAMLVVGAGAVQTAHNHPFGTSYYNEALGGVRGGADRKMMRQFWGYASRPALGWVDAKAPKGARIWTHNTTGWGYSEYAREGWRRRDLRSVRLNQADIALFHHQKAFAHDQADVWDRFGTAPVHVIELDGVPLLSVYALPKLHLAPATLEPKPEVGASK